MDATSKTGWLVIVTILLACTVLYTAAKPEEKDYKKLLRGIQQHKSNIDTKNTINDDTVKIGDTHKKLVKELFKLTIDGKKKTRAQLPEKHTKSESVKKTMANPKLKKMTGPPHAKSSKSELQSKSNDIKTLLNKRGFCDSYQFACENKRCIPNSWRCDNWDDCGDNSDEEYCGCQAHQFPCENRECVYASWQCDGYDDCGDNSDERGC
ncbi:uncharacterized protein LOC102806431, partial [Saccoglossus kowalevskii]|uniref:Low-density lipoprotein receptor-related protein 8-like n=1 Tax=Saccoglossus kowalevskii TaxID=10224 RepID=A0ABM0MYH4_SACKO